MELDDTYNRLKAIRKKIPLDKYHRMARPDTQKFRVWIESMRVLDLKLRQLELEVNASNLVGSDALESPKGPRHAWLSSDQFQELFGYSMELVSPSKMVGFE